MTLLDTHTWIWWEFAPERIPNKARALLFSAEDEEGLFVSVVSIWEIATKCALGKLELPTSPRKMVETAIVNPSLKVLPLSPDVAIMSAELPEPFHRDPADRLIVAQARRSRATLVTADRKILGYPHVKTVWE